MLSTRAHRFTIECMNGTLGDYVVERREAMGISQTELARRANLERTTVNRIETGTTKFPSAAVRRALASALGVSHIELVVAAGELSPSEADLSSDTRSEAVRRLAPVIDSYDFNSDQIATIERLIRALAGDVTLPRSDD